MILPELTLSAGRLGRLGCLLGVRVDAGQREMPVNDLKVIGVSVYQTL